MVVFGQPFGYSRFFKASIHFDSQFVMDKNVF